MQRIWVQLCGKNRYKVIILFMHKRKRGKWVFIDMIKGELLALLTRFSLGFFNDGGSLLFRFHLYSTKADSRKESKVTDPPIIFFPALHDVLFKWASALCYFIYRNKAIRGIP